jgi:hypothetical protein
VDDIYFTEPECFYKILDSKTLVPLYHISVSDADDPIYFLPDGTGYIYSGAIYDFSGEILLQSEMLHRYRYMITTVNNSPLYVYNGQYGCLKIWYADANSLTTQIPEEYLYDGGNEVLGNNGYYVRIFTDATSEDQVCFAVLDIWDNEWFRIPTDHTNYSFRLWDSTMEPFCIGNVSPLMAFLNTAGSICVYSCDDGSLIGEFSMDLPASSLINMEFVADDSYLMLQTYDGMFRILDVKDGTVAYSEIIYQYASSRYVLESFYDSQEQRLFIKGDLEHDSICIDTKTWSKLASIPKMLGYDSKNNMVYQVTVDPETSEHRIVATYFPPTDELIEIARSLVGLDSSF